MDRVSICESLLNQNKRDPLPSGLSVMKSRSQQCQTNTVVVESEWAGANGKQAKTDSQKGFWIYFWDWQRLIFFKLLPYGHSSSIIWTYTVTIGLSEVSNRPEAAVLNNRRGIVFLQDNVRPHISIVSR